MFCNYPTSMLLSLYNYYNTLANAKEYEGKTNISFNNNDIRSNSKEVVDGKALYNPVLSSLNKGICKYTQNGR